MPPTRGDVDLEPSLFEANPDPMLVSDGAGRIVAVNHLFEDLTGYTSDELVGYPVERLLPPELHDRHLAHRRNYERTPSVRLMGSGRLLEIMRKDGSRIPVDIGLSPIGRGNDLRVLAAVRDASHRKRAEQALATRAAEHKVLAELAQEVLSARDLESVLATGVRMVRAQLRADRCVAIEMDGHTPGLLRAADADPATQPPIQDAGPELPQAGYTLLARNPVLVRDYATEQRFNGFTELRELGLHSGVSAPIPGSRAPFGVLCALSSAANAFTTDHLEFLNAAAVILGSSVERSIATRRSEDQELRFRHLANHTQDLIFRVRLEPERRIEYVNPAVTSVLGHTPVNWYRDPMLLDRLILAAGGDPSPLWSRRQGRTAAIPVRTRRGEVRYLEFQISQLHDATLDTFVVEGIGRDVTEREQRNASLAQQLAIQREVADELREIDEMKTGFLEAVSHELRTPLTVIKGLAETLHQHGFRLDASERSQILERLVGASSRLDDLLSDLLDLNRLGRGVLTPRRRWVELGSFVEDVIAGFEVLTHPIEVRTEQVRAQVDPVMIERVIENLVGNAAKHTPEGTPITIRVHSDDDVAAIDVSDEGPGIPDELREALFAPFERGPTAPAHAPGSGIGLSLVRRFVELHDGTVEVDDHPGGGALFRLRLPRERTSDL